MVNLQPPILAKPRLKLHRTKLLADTAVGGFYNPEVNPLNQRRAFALLIIGAKGLSLGAANVAHVTFDKGRKT